MHTVKSIEKVGNKIRQQEIIKRSSKDLILGLISFIHLEILLRIHIPEGQWETILSWWLFV